MSGQGQTAAPTGFAAFLANVEAWAKAKEAQIVAVADKFLPELASDVEIAIEDLAEIAGAAVLAQAPAVISGTEKFGNAVTDVIQTVEAGGKTVEQQTAAMAVQQVYLAAQGVAVANTPAT